jgi:hypothetical protein
MPNNCFFPKISSINNAGTLKSKNPKFKSKMVIINPNRDEGMSKNQPIFFK